MTQRFPSTATNIISALTALVWVLTALAGYSDKAAFALGFIPLRMTMSVNFPAVPAALTPLSATLVHSGLIHLGFNLLMLVWCGAQVERVLGATGVIVLYLVGAYAAAGAQWAVDPMSATPMVGASGAISALFGLYALFFGRPKQVTRNMKINRWIHAVWVLAAWVILQWMAGVLAGGEGILLATPAHIGGFVAGMLLQRPLLLWRYRKA